MAKAYKSSVTLKSAGGDPKKLAANLEHDGDTALFATIMGRATGIGSKRENLRVPGEYYEGIKGDFEVSNPDTGETVASSTLYAPDAIHDQLIAGLKDKERTGPIEFAVEGYVVKGGTSGFTWKYVPLFQGTGNAPEIDTLADLRARIAEGKKALPAPAKGRKGDKGADAT